MLKYMVTKHGLDTDEQDEPEKQSTFRRVSSTAHAVEVGSSQARQALLE
jgi:hypothetical protein